MEEHKNVLVDCIQEQLYSGLDGTEHLLNPDYDTDTYFNEPGPWQNRAEQYKRWKEKITILQWRSGNAGNVMALPCKRIWSSDCIH